ncbi:MAG TPA: hypothetical protein VK168_20565 [Saprospiraceae bacterium]|nr:hypothetical protein [Saprospiraceae bacterium]
MNDLLGARLHFCPALAVPSQLTMQSDSRNFSAKLLLFGEHVLLLGATALAVPLTAFSGKWAWKKQKDGYFNKMMDFAQSPVLGEIPGLDVHAFQKDLNEGMYFEANIPTGYGLGSSGAFCAAVYHRYMTEPESDPALLKMQLSRMESFFHGNSSGIDPLTSYLGKPVVIQQKTQVSIAQQASWAGNAPLVFLLDSTLPRKSQPLIDWFLQQRQTPVFERFLQEGYLPAHEALINAWLEADSGAFWTNLRTISALQRAYFAPMVPSTVEKVWDESLEHGQFTFKICGAGGGGFVLGFTHNQESLHTLTQGFKLHFPLER